MFDKNKSNIRIRKLKNKIFYFVIGTATMVGVIFLALLFIKIFKEGFKWLSFNFINNFPSRFPRKAGIKSAIWGSIYTIVLTTIFTVPIGILSAVYLEEYINKKSMLNRILQLNILNLAGIPSIVYGILGLGLFVKFFALGRSIISASLTLSLLIMPVVIISSQEAIKSVPNTLREASLALGATKWQTIRKVVLPTALPSILTGIILAISRAIGEAAPIIMVGAAAYVPFLPKSIFDKFTILPIQIFNWTSRPQKDFQGLAAAGIIVLLLILLSLNAIAIYIRNKSRKIID